MSSAIQIYKKNPTLGEQRTSLINSSDGQGLHFDGAAGSIDIASPPDLGTKFSFEFIIQAHEWGSAYSTIVDFGDGGTFILGSWVANSYNLGIQDGGDRSFGVKVLDDLKVHHLVVTIDGTSAVLYDNGNQVGTTTLGTQTIDSATDAAIGSNYTGSAGFFNGTIYRARFYNRALSADDVRTAYEQADVDYSLQYGSQTNLVNPAANGDFSGAGNWVGQGNHSASIVSGELQVVASGASNGSSNAATLAATYGGTGTNGKVYKWEFTARASSGTPTLRARTPFDHSDVTTGSYKDFVLSTSNQTFSITGKRIALENAFFGLLEAGTFFIDNIKATQIGCVSDYDLAFASPTQSLTVQDRAGVADGTASTSGVTQVQPIIQGNLTSLAVTTSQQAAGVPADGDIIVSGGVGVGAAAGAGGHGLTVDKVVNDDWVAKIKNSGNTTPYGLQVDCQGANAVTAFAVYAGSAPNNTSFTIKPSGVVVQGGDVGIGQTPTANFGKLQVYATGDQTDETTAAFSIGDTATGGMRIYGGVNNTTNYAYIGAVESGTAYRALSLQPNGGNVGIGTPTPTVGNLQIRDASGSTLALTRTAGATTGTLGLVRFGNTDIDSNLANILVYQDNATDAAAIAFQTQATGGATADRLTIGSDGLCTFANGIQVNDAAGGMAQIQTGGAITIADDASITLSSTINEGALISVHHNTLGAAVLFYVTFASVAQIISDSSSLGSATDTDGKMCMIKTANSHAMTFKNRLGSSVTFKFAQLGGNLV